MEYGPEDITGLFEKSLRDNSMAVWTLSYDLAKQNAGPGKIWVMGGFVYRNVLRTAAVCPTFPEQLDVDFLIERIPEGDLVVPEEWSQKITRDYGNLSFSRGDLKIDLNYLQNFRSILVRNLAPTLENFFTGTPLDVQSIVYDPLERAVQGEIGIRSLLEKSVRINNIQEAKYEAEKKGLTLRELVMRKANEISFGYDLTIPGKAEEVAADDIGIVPIGDKSSLIGISEKKIKVRP